MHERKKVQTKIYPDKKFPDENQRDEKLKGRKNEGRKSADKKMWRKNARRKMVLSEKNWKNWKNSDTLPGWDKLLGLFFNKYLFGLYQAAFELLNLKSALSSDLLLLKLGDFWS